MCDLNEYMKASEHPRLIGTRAKILPKESYCDFLHGAEGVIQSEHDQLFLQFEEPRKVPGAGWPKMRGVYMTDDCYELIPEVMKGKCPCCGKEVEFIPQTAEQENTFKKQLQSNAWLCDECAKSESVEV